MPSFEERLARVEKIAEMMRDRNVSLEEAMGLFDEGVSISRGLEKELQEYECKVDQLVNLPDVNGGEETEIEPYLRE